MNLTNPPGGYDAGLIPPLNPKSAHHGKPAALCWLGRTSHVAASSRDEAYERPPQKLSRSKAHHRDWLDACQGGPPASANFDYGTVLTEVGLLGLVAMRTKKIIQWDAKAMKVTNAPEAEVFIKGSYRPGWELS